MEKKYLYEIYVPLVISELTSVGYTPMGDYKYSITIDSNSFVKDFGSNEVVLNEKTVIGFAYNIVRFSQVVYNFINTDK